MSAPFTPEQEARLREIAREEAIRVTVAASERLHQREAALSLDRHRLAPSELEERLAEGSGGRFL